MPLSPATRDRHGSAPVRGRRYIAAYSKIGKTSLRLEVSSDVVEIAEMGAGTVVWDEETSKPSHPDLAAEQRISI